MKGRGIKFLFSTPALSLSYQRGRVLNQEDFK
jgi:hypothetical protein